MLIDRNIGDAREPGIIFTKLVKLTSQLNGKKKMRQSLGTREKTYFSRRCLDVELYDFISRTRKNEKTVWQRRSWAYVIVDEDDYERHINYIHYNSVKHEYTSSPKELRYSILYLFVRKGIYDNK